MARDPDCVALLQWALPALGLRWQGFRRVRGQVCKRLKRRMAELNLDTAAYQVRLLADPEERRIFDGFCRISITRFYRDRAVFEHLRRVALPALLERLAPGEPLRVWSAGCAGGEEPYSLLLAVRLGLPDAVAGSPLEIIATDSDPVQLARAREAIYHRATLRELPVEWIERAFEPFGAEDLRLRDPYRSSVRFVQQDIRVAMPPGPFHLVLCRNLAFTYFEPALQERTLGRILERMVEGGLLVIGTRESLPEGHRELGQAQPHLPEYWVRSAEAAEFRASDAALQPQSSV